MCKFLHSGNLANKLWRPSCLSKPGALNENSNGQSQFGNSSTTNSDAQKSQSSAQNPRNSLRHNGPAAIPASRQGQKTVSQFYKSTSSTGGTSNVTSAKPVQMLLWNKLGSSGPKANEQKTVKSNPVGKPGGLPSSSGTLSLTGSCVLISRSRFVVDVGFNSKLS